MAKKISKDTPLSEITLRRYEKPYDITSKRDIVRKLCLGLGLLQPGDSRDVIVDILYVLLKARSDKKELNSEEIRQLVIENRKTEKLAQHGIAASNIRRQLKRLRNILLIEKIRNNYRVTEFSNLSEAFASKVEQYLLPSIISRVKEYISLVDSEF